VEKIQELLDKKMDKISQNLNDYFEHKFSKMDVIINTKMNKMMKDPDF
jgi:hypothetical protein